MTFWKQVRRKGAAWQMSFSLRKMFLQNRFMALSACLKLARHECSILLADLENTAVAAALGLNPDVVAVSIITVEFLFMKNMETWLKTLCYKILIICGWVYPTFYPEEIHEPYLNSPCRGEEDDAFLSFWILCNQGTLMKPYRTYG